MIRRILWDLGNVVILADHVITTAYLVSLGVPVKRARQFFKAEAYADFARGRLTGEEFYEHETTIVLGVPVAFDDVVRAHDAHMWGIDEDVVALMRRTTVPIAIATDTNVWQSRKERELIDVRQFADKIFRSNILGALKRDPGCFRRIVETLGDPPETLLLIDDSPEKIAQAETLGLQTIQYTDSEALEMQLMHRGCLR